MRIELLISKIISRNLNANIDNENIESLIEAFFEMGKVLSYYNDDIKFKVYVYQNRTLPVSLNVDFVVFLEQMLDFVCWISKDNIQENFVLSFYEQGIELDIEFDKKKHEIHYRHYNKSDIIENFNILELKKDIKLFYQKLIFCITTLIPDLLKFDEIREWLQLMRNYLS